MLEQCPNRMSACRINDALPPQQPPPANWSKAKRVKFYRNGDMFYEGMYYAISERFRTFESLLVMLTHSSVCDPKVLSTGVRFIFTLDGRRITMIEELVDGECYVCASTDHFKRIAYLKSTVRGWNPVGGSCLITARRIRSSRQSQEIVRADDAENEENEGSFKPRLITVVRNGIKPRKIVRVLLSGRTARTFTQALDTISATFQAAPIRRLYTLDKKPVTALHELLQNEESVFLACGNERQTPSDFILTEYEIRNLILQRSKTTTTTMPVAISTEIVSNSRKSSLTSSSSIATFNRTTAGFSSTSAPVTPQIIRRFTDEKVGTSSTSTGRPENLPLLRNDRLSSKSTCETATNVSTPGSENAFQLATPEIESEESF